MTSSGISKPYFVSRLTRSQLMIWTGQRLQSDDPLYNMAMSFRLRGVIDTDAFQTAFQMLIQQCDALRTTFTTDAGVPRQRIHENFEYKIEIIDLTAMDDPLSCVSSVQLERAQRSFDLNQCLFESTLIKLADDDFIWFLNQHHLITDAWSTTLIFRTQQNNYRQVLEGTPEACDPLPEFRAYVEYEDKKQTSKAMARAHDYWNKALSTAAPPSTFYRATPRNRSGVTHRIPCDLGVARSTSIKRLAQSDDFQAISTDLARFQIFATTLFAWLHRISGNEALSVGTPGHNRGTRSHKNTVGLFIEIFPLRVELDEQESFKSLYKKVAQRTKELLIHAPPGASSFEHHRAYDVVLNYITAKFGRFDRIPMQSQWVHANHGDRNHLLRMQVEEFDDTDQFRVFFDVNVDTFIGAEQQFPGQQFLRLMDSFLAAPDNIIADVDLLDAAERKVLAQGFAARDTAAVPRTSVAELFYAQAKRTPEATALTIDSLTISYAKLQQRVDALSAELQNRGIKPHDRIALVLPRSDDVVVAMLATLSCGASYVPVDPAYPHLRLLYLLSDSNAVLAITHNRYLSRLPKTIAALCLDETINSPAGLLVEQKPYEFVGHDTAYVMYTSGSTGQPKGVEVVHQGLSNYLIWAAKLYQPDGPARWPLFSSISFDLTVTSVFVPLISGGQIVVYPELDDQREITIRRVIEDNAVDIIKLTPAHLALIQAMDLSASCVKTLIVGGEEFTVELAKSISNYFGGRINLYNEYGPTEATVACMIHRYDEHRDTGTSVPIGRAIDNACVYVLNDNLQLQPRGVAGELYIGGTGVARGYLHRDNLTREHFLDNPYRPGEKFYRTGDLARSNADETLTYLGRCDQQIKMNGVRIEPAEIEAVLNTHPQIAQSAVQLTSHNTSGNADAEAFCVVCGISGRHPAALLDDHDTCKICHAYEVEREQALAYFRTLPDLQKIIQKIQSRTPTRDSKSPDCIMLLSGGKDSTYALCQLVDMGLTPLVFTLDNGYISEGAKANMRRVVDHLGLEFIVGDTPYMNAIFRDSLHRFSNVCNGCFKTIYTLSMKIARKRGITHIFTGLSRGQVFETRVADLFRQRVFDPQRIDALIIEARKAYHRADDTVSQCLDVKHFEDDAIFEEIQFVDYYRYTDVSLNEMLDYLKNRVPWVRPADTGRSTNCLINEAGIYVHKKERGFHNYSLPYSWDVRLGHKERDAAREELDDNINLDNVQRILGEIAYTPRDAQTSSRIRRSLTAYYVCHQDIAQEELTRLLEQKLPGEMIPAYFVRLDTLPLSANGKLDRGALPHPDLTRPQLGQQYVAPEGQVETVLSDIWAQAFGIDKVGVNDNFFDLGGDSILNIQIVALASKHGLMLSPQQVFDYPTIAELKTVVGSASQLSSEQGQITGRVPLTPIQHRFFAMDLNHTNGYSQSVLLNTNGPLDILVLEEAVRQLLAHHDALRSRFFMQNEQWQQRIVTADDRSVEVEVIALTAASTEHTDHLLETHARRLHDELNIQDGPLLKVAVFEHEQRPPQVFIVIHHLVVDAVSWWILLEDLEDAYARIRHGQPVKLALKTTSIKHWAHALDNFAKSPDALNTLPLWPTDVAPDAYQLPTDDSLSGDNSLASVNTVSVSLSTQDTHALMGEVAARWRSQPHDLMIAALLQTLWKWQAQGQLVLDIEAHGRENISDELDLLRTVGWFTSVYPVHFACQDNASMAPNAVLRVVTDTLRAIPSGGVAYGAMRYLKGDEAAAAVTTDPRQAPVLFNYMGKWRQSTGHDATFSFAKPLMATLSTQGDRPYMLELNASVFGGRLHVDWTYSTNLHTRTTMTQLAEQFNDNLTELITYCLQHDDTQLSRQDIQTADLSHDDLDDILAEFGES